MSNLNKLLSLVIFTVSIWSVNSFLYPRLSSGLKNLNISEQELKIKQAFNDNSPAKLSTSINDFVLPQFDRNDITNLIDRFAKDAGVSIVSIDIQVGGAINSQQNISSQDDNSESKSNSNLDVLMTENVTDIKTNTLKVVDLNINIKGPKTSIDRFLSNLSSSKQYIDIQDISISIDNNESSQQNIQLSIAAQTYYKKL
ncbi:MAG: hypothetical protein RJB24_223 [Candidatus Parcubacteria bacterium]|jgi:hypothetical protein